MAPTTLILLPRNRRVLIGVVLLSVFRPSTQQACQTHEFRCDNGRCINAKYVCDNHDSCGDSSDERRCTYPPVDMTKALVCSVNTHVGPKSYLLKLFGDPDGYAYKLGNDTFEGKLPIHINGRVVPHYDIFHALSIDYDMHRVYFSNNNQQLLEYGLFVHHNSTKSYYYIAVPKTSQMNGVAIDWTTKNLYWTDGLYKIIGVMPSAVNVAAWKAIIDRNLSSPQDVAVNPVLRYLFWSDGTYGSAKIERSDLSGNNRTVLVSSAEGLASPTTLVVDFSSQKLYWLDSAAQKIGRVNFDGSELFTQIISSLSQVSAMTVYRNYVYFGSNNNPEIYIYDKTSLRHISSYTLSGRGGITDMAMYASDVQPSATSPCTTNNGGCSQFCWTLSSTTRVCDCAVGFFLASDGATCTSRPFWTNDEYLVVADFRQRYLYQLKPESDEVRAILMSPCSPVSLAFDSSINGIYVICYEKIPNSDRYKYRIRKKTFDDKINEAIYNAPEGSTDSKLHGLALDAERKLLYYTDRIQGIVAEIMTNGSNRREIFSDPSKHPRAIVVDSNSRRIYWSDCSGPATIQTARVADGRDRRTLVSDSQSTCIVDITIDFHNELMYWVSINNPALKMAFLNGTGEVTLLDEPKADYTGITLYNNCLYISDSSRRNIIKFNLTSRAMSSQPPGLFSHAHDVKYFNTSKAVSTRLASTPSSASARLPSVTASSPSTPTSTSGAGEGNNLVLIVATTAGVGGLLVLVVVIVVVLLICVFFRKSRSRSAEPGPPDTNAACAEIIHLPPLYDEVPGAVGQVNKTFDSKYESLKFPSRCSNSLAETPPLPSSIPPKRPPAPPPVKPKPKPKPEEPADHGDYIHFSRER